MIIKCKMCGGDLHPESGKTTFECEFCGTVQTIPTDNGEKKTNLFNRANRLRMGAEFDKAASVYESIVAEFPEEAEAYWGLCLCAYGIEYVDDPATGEKKPTCHRTLPSSIMEDSNFEQACDNADPIARRVYREEAKAIDRIQRDILSIVSSEKPYDVFICYKETAEDGGRTEDSVLAQDIYDTLTGKGLRVFFSRITLEDKLGQQYEPYIYAALSSAKVMLAVGTKFEYYDAVWVKNEWMRFLSMMKTDKQKTLIPCYKGIDAYDMPREFKNLQAQDMGKIGWLQDLTRGVMKLCQKEESKPVVVQQIVQSGNPTTDSLLERAYLFLEEEKWDEANQYLERVLDADPRNSKAYIGKMMIEMKIRSPKDLLSQTVLYEQIDENEYFKKAIQFSNGYHDKAFINPFLKLHKQVQPSKQLLEAVQKSDVDLVRTLLEQGAIPDYERVDPNGNRFSVLRDSIVEWPNDDIANLLIEAGADVNHSDQEETRSYPILISAIMKGNTGMVKRLLEKGANPNCEIIYKDGQRYSALRCSIFDFPNDEIANFLIDAGADVNYVYQGKKSSYPILISAIMKGNTGMVKRLLEKGADPNCKTMYGTSAIEKSITEDEAIANLLIDAGADVNQAVQRQGSLSILMFALIERKAGVVKHLLGKGANPNCEVIYPDGERCSALWQSIHWRDDEIANLLIDAGADINYSNQDKRSSCPILITAIRERNTGMVKRLLEKGADPNCEEIFKDGNRFSALRTSITGLGRSDEIANLLIDAEADVNHSDQEKEYSCPILITAIHERNTGIVKRLLEKGADPNCEAISKDGRDQYSALRAACVAAIRGNGEIANLLIDAGADVNHVNQQKGTRTPMLVSAIETYRTGMVKLLLEKGANPNCEEIIDNGGRYSALANALMYGNIEIAKLLIDAGADINYLVQELEDKRPVLFYAIFGENPGMVKLLLEKGVDPNCVRIFKDSRRYSALRTSIVEKPNDEIANLLIDAGADVNCLDQEEEFSCPILNSAICKGNISMVKRLLEKGANPNCERVFKNGARYNALFDSIRFWPNKEISRLLVKTGARGDRKICFGNDREAVTMMYALFEGDPELKKLPLTEKLEHLEILIDAGARFDHEPDSIRKMKISKAEASQELLSKMKKAGWRASLFS